MTSAARVQKALKEPLEILTEKHKSSYVVKGSAGALYSVNIDGDRAECTCPDHTNRKIVCKHIIHCIIIGRIRKECPYGSKCYRTNLQHQAECSHKMIDTD